METVKCLTPDELQSHLEDLKIILLTLPRYLPVENEFYNFRGCTPEPKSVQDYGEEGALNQDLENTFCPKGRHEPIVPKEVGPATEKANDAACESAAGNAFDIEDIIDVNNLDLHDTLSGKPISKPKPLPKEKQPTSVVAAAKELVESDWVL